MIKRSFLGFATPRLRYSTSPGPVEELAVPNQVTLLLEGMANGKGVLKVGDTVKTGQKLSVRKDGKKYVISSVTGAIAGLAPYVGMSDWKGTAVTINSAGKDEWDDTFRAKADLETALNFFEYLPGGASFAAFKDPEKTIRTIVINGMDKDLLLTVNQAVVQNNAADIRDGVQALKKITGVDRIVLVVPQTLTTQANNTGADVKTVGHNYPDGFPHLIMKNLLGQVVPEGETVEDNGAVFFTAEAVAALGKAMKTGKLPVTKLVTVVGKDGSAVNVAARIGTPLNHILKARNISAQDRDRVILGGPITGAAAHSLEQPVETNTDGVVVQSDADCAKISDTPCTNCGECVRICPVKIPVNMLVRFLEPGYYEEARDMYDLDCCIECGLCAYVCESHIPIFHYIKLGKYELSLMTEAEAASE
jgi:Na+-translocating ferredoxin:NAD+ oxidoreductase subunit C